MAERIIDWTETASKQRRAVLLYWAKRNNSTVYSEKLIELIRERLKVISNNPNAFKETDFPNIREASMGHFSIYYTYSESKITVTAFWDNRQDSKELIKIFSV